MRIGRAIIIPAVLALTTAGAVISGSGMAMAASTAPAVHVAKTTLPSATGVYYRN